LILKYRFVNFGLFQGVEFLFCLWDFIIINGLSSLLLIYFAARRLAHVITVLSGILFGVPVYMLVKGIPKIALVYTISSALIVTTLLKDFEKHSWADGFTVVIIFRLGQRIIRTVIAAISYITFGLKKDTWVLIGQIKIILCFIYMYIGWNQMLPHSLICLILGLFTWSIPISFRKFIFAWNTNALHQFETILFIWFELTLRLISVDLICAHGWTIIANRGVTQVIIYKIHVDVRII